MLVKKGPIGLKFKAFMDSKFGDVHLQKLFHIYTIHCCYFFLGNVLSLWVVIILIKALCIKLLIVMFLCRCLMTMC
jgi:hypothetical protein